MGWLSGTRLNHRVYTILEYNPAIIAMATTTTTDQDELKAFSFHCSLAHTQASSAFKLKANNIGMLTISEKIQEPGMITWNCGQHKA